MERNTVTTLGALRQGDRFYFAGKRDEVWEVIELNRSTVEINKRDSNGGLVFKFGELKRHSMSVVFLRHTINQPC